MCDHCAKVTSQKGYAGQVTCKCEHGEKGKEGKEKDFGGCCSRKAREAAGGCCMSGCCKDNKKKEAEAPSKCCADRK
ncbi:uncharacterized protein LOC113465062 [Ceratina calcarata]|uniref:Uncharacterized protein LOC113465062 n=1 Tax=Ceratina calcarata TaxID=156304 RepID=A0AAJ7SAA0_9HYME|nr:uncharacterized protein LOC113465062 [Ceratina calcarata]XP_026674233.1 uncharacterized protein LOC113465062 [Ceratina calcarata]